MEKKPLKSAMREHGRKEPVEAPQDAPKEQRQKITPDIPGMKSETWSGIPMFRCENCSETFFDRNKATNHTCKKVKYASEGDD